MFSAIKLVVKPHSYGIIGALLVSGVPDSGVGKGGGVAFGRKEAVHEERYFNQKQKEQIEVVEKKLAEMKIESPAQFASGVAGSGVGRGGGGGGSIRDAGSHSVQSPFQLSVNPGGDTNLTAETNITAETNSSADTNDASQLLSSVDTTAVGNHSTLGASDLEAFQNELSSHPMKVPELLSEGLGEKEVLANEVNDELYNSILTTSESKLSGMKVNDDVEEDYNIEEVTNACLTLSLNDDNVVVEKIDKNSSLESEKQATDGTVKAVIEEEKAAVLNGDVIQKIEVQE